MLIKGITIAQAERIAFQLGITINPDNGKRGNYIRVTLRPSHGNLKYRAINKNQFNYGRKKWAVCWHGHRDFMRMVYEYNPAAVIRTAYAVYKNAAHFEETFEQTGTKNVGSIIYPVYAANACDCEE